MSFQQSLLDGNILPMAEVLIRLGTPEGRDRVFILFLISWQCPAQRVPRTPFKNTNKHIECEVILAEHGQKVNQWSA